MEADHVTGQSSAIDRAVRLQLKPAATRMVGAELFVNAGGSTAPVQRLGGAGPELWAEFAAGRTIAEAAATLVARTGASPSEVEAVVQAFAQQLLHAELAETTW